MKLGLRHVKYCNQNIVYLSLTFKYWFFVPVYFPHFPILIEFMSTKKWHWHFNFMLWWLESPVGHPCLKLNNIWQYGITNSQCAVDSWSGIDNWQREKQKFHNSQNFLVLTSLFSFSWLVIVICDVSPENQSTACTIDNLLFFFLESSFSFSFSWCHDLTSSTFFNLQI